MYKYVQISTEYVQILSTAFQNVQTCSKVETLTAIDYLGARAKRVCVACAPSPDKCRQNILLTANRYILNYFLTASR